MKTFDEYHPVGYVIGDVKVNNYMWNEATQVMTRVDKDTTQRESPQARCIVTVGCAAPETKDDYTQYTMKSEIFSAGVLLMEIFSPFYPYYRQDLPHGEFQFHVQAYYQHEPKTELEKSIWNLCKKMVDTNPTKRPNIAQVYAELETIEKLFTQAIADKRSAELALKNKIDGLKNDFSKIDNVYDLILVYNSLQHEGRINYYNVEHIYTWNSQSNLEALKKRFLELVRDQAQVLAGSGNAISAENFQQALQNTRKQAKDNHWDYDLNGLLNHRRHVWFDKKFRETSELTTTCRNFINATQDEDTSGARLLAAKELMEQVIPTRRLFF